MTDILSSRSSVPRLTILVSRMLFPNTVMKDVNWLIKTEADTSVTAVDIPENSRVFWSVQEHFSY